LLVWEFFAEPGEAWDSVEIRMDLKPGLAIAAWTLAWPQSGPWAEARPRLERDSGTIRIKAWRGGAVASESSPIATLSVELRSEATRFEDVEADLKWKGFGAATGTRAAVRTAAAQGWNLWIGPGEKDGAAAGRDALGRAGLPLKAPFAVVLRFGGSGENHSPSLP
jgi:hypothetical protein